MRQTNTCNLVPIRRWYNFQPRREVKTDISAEELQKQVWPDSYSASSCDARATLTDPHVPAACD